MTSRAQGVRCWLALVVGMAAAAMTGCPSQVATTCGDASARCGPPADQGGPPRFFVDPPFGVGFTCVTLGCSSEETLTVSNRGGGKLGLALIRTSVDSSTDFQLRRADGAPLPTPDNQAFLGAGETLDVVVAYAPSDGVLDEGTIQFEHFDGATAYEESTPTTDTVPLQTRLVGEPAVELPTELLDFGFVAAGASLTREVSFTHTGADGVLRVGPATLEDPSVTMFRPASASAWEEQLANPGESAEVAVDFAPESAGVFFAALLVETNDPARPVVRVLLQGTAIPEPRLLVIDPAGILAMPAVRAGETRTGTVTVQNIGGLPLDVNASITAGVERGLSVAPGAVAAIPALGTTVFEVSLTSQQGGPVTGTLTLSSNDPTVSAGAAVEIRSDVNAPLLAVEPAAVDFGDVVQGWFAEPRTITLANRGYGELTVTALTFEVGSSPQISLVDVPLLPLKLSPDEAPVELTVLFTATAIGAADSVLLVQTDSVSGAETRVNLHGDVITCEQGCPVANGTPNCSSGACDVGSCSAGFHDSNDSAGDGCECREDVVGNVVADIGQACGQGRDIGELHDGNDNGTRSATISGTLHQPSDMDLFFFRAKDDECFFCSDNYGAEVTLSGPAGLQLCVNYQAGGTGCGGLPTNCRTIGGGGGPVTIRGNGQSGAFGSSDNDEDVTVFVLWPPGSPQVCGAYDVSMRADADF